MSGTPIPNSYADLVPQFSFLYPEIKAFPSNVSTLIQPIYVRTTKDELGLPDPVIRLREIPMTESHRLLYDALRSEEARRLSGFKASDRIRLRKAGKSAMRLLQAVSNPALLQFGADIPEDLLAETLRSGDTTKLYYATKRARELAKQNRKVVIWSSFVKNVELIADRLSDIGADYIHGGVAAGDDDEEDTREAKVKAFHDDQDKMVLVANPAACGEGISLHTVCNDAIYVDRTYNATQYLQSRDRIHRLGLSEGATTRIEILVAPGTVDGLVHKRLTAKIKRMAKVLNDDQLLKEEESAGNPEDPYDINLTLEDLDDFISHLKET